ncbi:unnamed protein product [Haemonchus placei]|uniref:Secreted protein n=1 Tax=Haemonchus placei TaxID=6290 RepID=A0A0N4WI36_HAEPC|nr:unnamed protein product [Haemonchus placei]
MERLLFAFVFIGATLACQPVPEPYKNGFGHDTAHVIIVTDQEYDQSKVDQYMSYFPQTKVSEKIKQYASQLGVFSNLGYTDVDGYFAFTFTISQCVCEYVKEWVNQIVQSSQYYISGNALCNSQNDMFPRMVLPPSTTTTTTTTTTASPSKVIPPVPGYPPAPGYLPVSAYPPVAVYPAPVVVVPQYPGIW